MGHYFFSEAHEAFRKEVRRFVDEEVRPHIEEWEKAEGFPSEIFKRMGQLGLLGIRYPKEYGGRGADYFTAFVLQEELARCGGGGFPMGVAVHSEMATTPLFKFGTEEQKQRWLVPAIKGEKIFCLGITEPNAGSDVANIQTKAVKDGKYWVINGSKIFITNGVRADCILAIIRTSPGKGYAGFSLFVVEKGTPGFSVSRKLEKVGMRASDTAELVFEDCRVPEDNLIGEEGKGFYGIMWELQGERLIAAAGIQATKQALGNIVAYLRERMQSGRPIAGLQAIAYKVAELATEAEAVQQLTYQTAWRIEQGQYPVKEISMAKLVASQLGFKVADLAVQVFGSPALTTDLPVERGWRDARLTRIGAGTDEIMKEIIAMGMGLQKLR